MNPNTVVAVLLGEWKEDETLRANELASSGADQDEGESSMSSMNDNVGSGSSSPFGIVRNVCFSVQTPKPFISPRPSFEMCASQQPVSRPR
jgi:hypothetical protein